MQEMFHCFHNSFTPIHSSMSIFRKSAVRDFVLEGLGYFFTQLVRLGIILNQNPVWGVGRGGNGGCASFICFVVAPRIARISGSFYLLCFESIFFSRQTQLGFSVQSHPLRTSF